MSVGASMPMGLIWGSLSRNVLSPKCGSVWMASVPRQYPVSHPIPDSPANTVVNTPRGILPRLHLVISQTSFQTI